MITKYEKTPDTAEDLQISAADQPFAARHRMLVRKMVRDTKGVERSVTVNDAESPLSRLRSRGLIDKAQFDAGEKLRRDFTIAGMTPNICSNLTQPLRHGGASRGHMSDTVLAAKQRYTLAMKAVGPTMSGMLTDVCCHLIGLEALERELTWPRHSARVVLSLGLDHLAAHYGLVVTNRSARMRSWRQDRDRDAAQSA
jgi:hypothetical protein